MCFIVSQKYDCKLNYCSMDHCSFCYQVGAQYWGTDKLIKFVKSGTQGNVVA